MSYFFQHPFGLSTEQRMANLHKKMWLEGSGIFWYIFEKLRLGGGKYPLDSILLAAGSNASRQRKIKRVLTEFDLFCIENGMVSLQSGLSVADLLPKKRLTPQDKVAEIHKAMEDEASVPGLFPEESRQMLESALCNAQQTIRDQNARELSCYE